MHQLNHDSGDFVSATHIAALAFASVLLVVAVLASFSIEEAQAQTPSSSNVTFDSIENCRSLESKLKVVGEQSKVLDAVLALPPEDSEQFLKGIFIGTQTMLEYGRLLFEATAAHEDSCKQSLQQAGKHAEIIQIYNLLLGPTVRGHDFLVRVREGAAKLGDTSTRDDMDEAIRGYNDSMKALVSFCGKDLKEHALPEGAKKPCQGFRAEIDARTGDAKEPKPATAPKQP